MRDAISHRAHADNSTNPAPCALPILSGAIPERASKQASKQEALCAAFGSKLYEAIRLFDDSSPTAEQVTTLRYDIAGYLSIIFGIEPRFRVRYAEQPTGEEQVQFRITAIDEPVDFTDAARDEIDTYLRTIFGISKVMEAKQTSVVKTILGVKNPRITVMVNEKEEFITVYEAKNYGFGTEILLTDVPSENRYMIPEHGWGHGRNVQAVVFAIRNEKILTLTSPTSIVVVNCMLSVWYTMCRRDDSVDAPHEGGCRRHGTRLNLIDSELCECCQHIDRINRKMHEKRGDSHRVIVLRVTLCLENDGTLPSPETYLAEFLYATATSDALSLYKHSDPWEHLREPGCDAKISARHRCMHIARSVFAHYLGWTTCR